MPDCPQLEQLEDLIAGRVESAALRAHVAGCASCRSRSDEIREDNLLLARVASARPAPPPPPLPPVPPAHAPPEIDGYRVVAELHRGGQGIVFEAVQLSTQRRVALKVLLEGTFATTQQLRRFEREIETVLRLRHPHLVTVYDRGVTRDGRHFFAMEYVDGVALDRHAQARRAARWTPGEAVDLFRKLCDAVNYAHQRGVIHRDLKPGNVLVDPAGEPRVLDFGLAKAVVDETAPPPVTLTRPGWFVGTLAYASPEQLRGDPDQIDVRSDVYSLGVMLFELLTGGFPYDVDRAMPDVVHAILEEEPRFPGGARAIGDELAAILQRALAKERAERYQTAGDLGRDLDRWRRGEPIDAKRGRLGYLLRKTVRRYRVRVALAGAMLLVLVGAAIFSTLAWQRARADAEQARIDAKTRGRVTALVENMLSSINPDRAKGRTVTVREVLDEAERRLGVELADEPAVEAELRTTLGRTYGNLGDAELGEAQLVRALELLRRLHPEGHESVALALLDRADIVFERADAAAAESQIRAAQELLERLGAGESALMSRAISQHARVRFLVGDHAAAEELHRRAVALRRRVGSEVDVAVSLGDLSQVLLERGAFEEAEAQLREALVIRRALGDPEILSTATTLRQLAQLLLRTERAGEARDCIEEALRIDRKLLGPDHPTAVVDAAMLAYCVDHGEGYEAARALHEEASALRPAVEGRESVIVAFALNAFGLLARDAGALDEAEREFKASLGMYDRLVGRDHPAPITVRDNLAWLLHLRGRHAESERLARETLAVRRERLGRDDAGVAVTLLTLAWTSLELDRFDDAERFARESLQIRARAFGPEHGATCRSRNALAWTLHVCRRDDEAAALARENLELQQLQLGEGHPDVAQTLHNLAEIESALGNGAEAEALYSDAIELRRAALGDGSLDLATSLDNFGWFLVVQRRHDEAGPLLEEALRIRLARLGEGHPLLGWSLNNVGVWRYFRGELDEAAALFEAAIEMGRRVLAPNRHALGVWLGNLGTLRHRQSDLAAAEPLLLEAHAILRVALGRSEPRTVAIADRLAAIYRALGSADRAAEFAAEVAAAGESSPQATRPIETR